MAKPGNWTTVGTWNFTYPNTSTSTTSTYNYQLMVATGNCTNGWFLNKFHAFQKVNNQVYTYVMPRMYGMYCAQMYMRGNASICTLEARTTSNTSDPTAIFQLAENWLVQYSDGNPATIQSDFYYIGNPEGAWGMNAHLKLYYINGNEKGKQTE